jgi:threonine/homoserine/homoserine lactone efflux protein
LDFQHWLAFATASAVVVAIPGPTVILIVSYALSQGRRAALPLVAGVTLGDLTSMTASMLGLGALLLTSAALFTALKWIGAAYLIWLGLKLWREPVETSGDQPDTAVSGQRLFWHTYAVTALNPKSIVFFVAFLPQFLDRAAPLVPQMVICEATFLALGTLNAALYVLQATAARTVLRKPSIRRIINRVGGSLLMGAGVFGLAWRSGSP